MLMEMQITANSTTSTNNDLIKGKSTITDIGKKRFLGRDIKTSNKEKERVKNL